MIKIEIDTNNLTIEAAVAAAIQGILDLLPEQSSLTIEN